MGGSLSMEGKKLISVGSVLSVAWLVAVLDKLFVVKQ